MLLLLPALRCNVPRRELHRLRAVLRGRRCAGSEGRQRVAVLRDAGELLSGERVLSRDGVLRQVVERA